jgi:hypothetical protein
LSRALNGKRTAQALQFQGSDAMAKQSPQRQYIKTIETHAGSAQPLPDNRLLLTLDDGPSFVIDAERLEPQADGTYVVELIAADHQ